MFRNTKKKQIIFVRHAKAFEREDWKGSDFDRPLLPLWEKSNTVVANYLRLIWLKPDRILSSPSARTRSTAVWMSTKLSVSKVEYADVLYTDPTICLRDPTSTYLSLIQDSKKSCHTLMFVGHNPDLTQVARSLSWDEIPSMKKWSVVVLSIPEDLEWNNITPGSLKFIYYLTPQFLRLEELV